MRRRTRKFIGAVLMLSFVIVYALVAMALAQARIFQEAPGIVQGIAYALLGLAWIFPVMPLIAWMERSDAN
ncbi:DUF2842 domain-containing protein [Beijerinckia indica]|uniref:DUF2842 domain-containing protein n=1 Tax=Beijerinckia indica subsp. indica (strain ATCC 9039 / DSM 1715 / NCIMB 8712) TaxID=395963 RepID=B2IH43_BEII9|nr:DUF2842 domain-containing protein [Beijerinckia indica]ACB94457.1 conserved hypothetical protein [Beijerinckia indica subsp. indica ATCC 9039]